MGKVMRSFLAIPLPEDIRTSLGVLCERLRKSGAAASWVKMENMHLTLRFLGDVTETDLARFSDELKEEIAAFAPIQLRAAHAGAFPNLKRPSVVWVGAGVITGELDRVQETIEHAARRIGLPPEPKPFHPHITLGRIRDARRLGTLAVEMALVQDFFAGEFAVRNVALFSSTLTPRGPVYRILREFSFACS